MDLVGRATRILLDPRREWQAIGREAITPAGLYRAYIAPLAAIGPVASVVGLSVVGISMPVMGHLRYPLAATVPYAIASYLLTLLGVYVVARIADVIAPSFSGARDLDLDEALKLVAFAGTAAWLGGIFAVVPGLWFLGLLASLYSVYLLYLGATEVMGVPPQSAAGYTAVVALSGLVVGLLIGGLTSPLLRLGEP